MATIAEYRARYDRDPVFFTIMALAPPYVALAKMLAPN
jgi:hypothetical protein